MPHCPTGGANSEKRKRVTCPQLAHMFCWNVRQLDGKTLKANHNDILPTPSFPRADSISCVCVQERCPTSIIPWKCWIESLVRVLGGVMGGMMRVLAFYFFPSGWTKWRTTLASFWQAFTQLWAAFTPLLPSLRLESWTLGHPFNPQHQLSFSRCLPLYLTLSLSISIFRLSVLYWHNRNWTFV